MTVQQVSIENMAEELKEVFLDKIASESAGNPVVIHNLNITFHFHFLEEKD